MRLTPADNMIMSQSSLLRQLHSYFHLVSYVEVYEYLVHAYTTKPLACIDHLCLICTQNRFQNRTMIDIQLASCRVDHRFQFLLYVSCKLTSCQHNIAQ